MTLSLSIILSVSLQAADKPVHSAVTPEPRSGGWMKRHESFNQRVAKGNVDLIFIGDSITHAWESSGKAVWEKHYAKRNAVNLGISGDRTQHVLWRLDNGNIKNIHPKVAVIMIGTNNSGDGRNTAAQRTHRVDGSTYNATPGQIAGVLQLPGATGLQAPQAVHLGSRDLDESDYTSGPAWAS